MFEQTKGKFHTQYTADGFVHGRFWNLAGADQLRQVLVIEAAHHVHVHTSEGRLARSSRAIVSDAVRDEFPDRGVIAVHNSPESPLSFENLFQREWIRGCGHAIQRIKGTHQ